MDQVGGASALARHLRSLAPGPTRDNDCACSGGNSRPTTLTSSSRRCRSTSCSQVRACRLTVGRDRRGRRRGWFEAHRLLAPAVDSAAREAMDDDYARLIRGETIGLAERADLERRLVAALTHGCARMVVGYTVKEEFIDACLPGGELKTSPTTRSQRARDSPVFLSNT